MLKQNTNRGIWYSYTIPTKVKSHRHEGHHSNRFITQDEHAEKVSHDERAQQDQQRPLYSDQYQRALSQSQPQLSSAGQASSQYQHAYRSLGQPYDVSAPDPIPSPPQASHPQPWQPAPSGTDQLQSQPQIDSQLSQPRPGPNLGLKSSVPINTGYVPQSSYPRQQLSPPSNQPPYSQTYYQSPSKLVHAQKPYYVPPLYQQPSVQSYQGYQPQPYPYPGYGSVQQAYPQPEYSQTLGGARQIMNDQIAPYYQTNNRVSYHVGSGSDYSWRVSGVSECSRTCGGGELIKVSSVTQVIMTVM